MEAPYRRRGFGEAMTWAAIVAGLDRRATDAWLCPTDMSHRLYGQMGFRRQYTYINMAPLDAQRKSSPPGAP